MRVCSAVFGLAVLAVSIGFMLLFGRNMLSKRLTAEEAGARQPTSVDLVGSYGLADKWHRLQVPSSSPLIDRSIARMQLLDRFGVVRRSRSPFSLRWSW